MALEGELVTAGGGHAYVCGDILDMGGGCVAVTGRKVAAGGGGMAVVGRCAYVNARWLLSNGWQLAGDGRLVHRGDTAGGK